MTFRCVTVFTLKLRMPALKFIGGVSVVIKVNILFPRGGAMASITVLLRPFTLEKMRVFFLMAAHTSTFFTKKPDPLWMNRFFLSSFEVAFGTLDRRVLAL